MCEHGTTTPVEVMIVSGLSHTGFARRAVVEIDSCISALVRALDQAGIIMRSSCCGHGKGGEIVLEDGRTLIIATEGMV